ASLDYYERIRGIKTLVEEENILEEDEICIDMVTSSKDPKRVIRLAREMEQGNSLFKKGEFDDALERYGYARLILSQYNFKEDDQRIQCCDLILYIWLNLIVCFSKNKDYNLELDKEDSMGERMDGVMNESNPKKTIMVESKYWLIHRRRLGSPVSISKYNYEMLLKGKSILQKASPRRKT
ncbi:Protein TANC1, partial [Bienertia sinuspersici]